MVWKRLGGILVLAFLVLTGFLYVWRFVRYTVSAPVRGEYLTVDNQSLYITDQGSGKPVVFLPGFIFHGDAYFNVVKNPPKGFRYITLDWPGQGYSTRRGDRPSTPVNLALLVKLLADKMELGPITLVGFDLGGGVAMVCAARNPKLVHGLFLIAPDSSEGEASSAMGPWWHWPVVNVLWASYRLDRGFIRDLVHQAWAGDNDQWGRFVERYYQPLDFENGRTNFLAGHLARRQFYYLPYEERLDVKTMILWGGQDRINPPGHGRALTKLLHHATMVTLPGAGHLIQDQMPEKVSQQLLKFLKTVDYGKRLPGND